MNNRGLLGASAWLLGLLVALCASGCSHSELRGKDIGRVQEPPKPPKLVPMALDPALRQSAQTELDKAFHSSDPFMRANAVEGYELGLGVEARDVYLAALDEPDSIVRFAGCMSIGTLQIAEAKPRLVALADGKDQHVEVAALYALHRLGDVRRSHRLETLARDPDQGTRADVATVLGMLGEPSGMNILKVMKNDDDFVVRAAAWTAMWRLGNEDGLKSLVGLAYSQHPDDQIIGLLGLAAPKDHRVWQHLRAELINDYPEVALAAARGLGEIGQDDGYAVVLQYVNSPDARVRNLAAFALGAIGRSDSQPKLAILLQDQDPHVRLAAAVAILRLKAQ